MDGGREEAREAGIANCLPDSSDRESRRVACSCTSNEAALNGNPLHPCHLCVPVSDGGRCAVATD